MKKMNQLMGRPRVNRTPSIRCFLLILSLWTPGWAVKIVYPWRATTAIVKAGEAFDVWLVADSGQTVNSVQLQGPYHTVNATQTELNGSWIYDKISGNTYNKKITVTVPSGTPEERYNLIVKTSTGDVTSQSAVKVVKQYKSSFYVLHVSDSHRWQGGYNATTILRKVSAVIDYANIIDPQVIIDTGDVSYGINGRPERAEQIYNGIPSLGIKGYGQAFAPTFIAPGNHDNPTSASTVSDAVATANWYNGYHGLTHYNFAYGDARFMILNNTWGSGADPTRQVTDAKNWLTSTAGNGTFRIGAFHGPTGGPVDDLAVVAGMNMGLAGHTHTASVNPRPNNVYVAADLRANFQFNLYKVDTVAGTYAAVPGVKGNTDAILNMADRDNPALWQLKLTLDYANSNDGSFTDNTATITNKFNFPIEGARVRFVMPLGAEYAVTPGTIQQAFDGDAVHVVDVRVDLDADSTTAINIYQSGSLSNSAQFISQSVTNVMNPGQTYPVSITMKNTGLGSWQTVTGHSLGSYNPENNTNWGISEVSLAGTVATNEETTFTFNVTAPAERGLYNFQWRMNDDLTPNEGWFGELTSTVVVTVGAQDIHIEGEDFVTNVGFQTQTTTDVSGGLHTAYADPGDYLTYDINVTHPGVYNAYFRLSSASAGSKFDLKIGSTVLCSVNEPPTGDWSLWETSPAYRVTLPGGSVTLTVLATGNSWNMNWFELIPVGNVPPDFTSSPDQFVEVGSAYTYTVTTSDFEGDDVTLSGETVPAWLTFNANSGVLTGTPSSGDIGAHSVVLRAADTNSYSDQSFTVTVSAIGNDAPVITSVPDTGVIEDNAYSYTIAATDADGDSLTYSAPTKPSWIIFNSGTQILSGTPAPSDVGLHLITLNVSDGSIIVTQQFNIAVFSTPVPANLIQNPSFEDDADSNSRPDFWGTDSDYSRSSEQKTDGSYSVKGTGNGSIGGISQTISLTTNTDYNLSVDIYYASGAGIVVFDTRDKFDSQGTQTTLYSPNGAWTPYTSSFNSGTNTSVDLRTYTSSLVNGVFYLDNVVLVQAGVVGNTAPVITSIPATNATQGVAYSYTLLAADADADTLVMTGGSIPAWLSFNTNNGALTGTPDGANVGSHSVRLRVSDGGHSVTQDFTVVVAPAGTSGYDTWAEANAIIGGPTDDDDGDGLNNLCEYAISEKPTFTQAEDSFTYAYQQRIDDPNLRVELQTCSNLISGIWTTNGASVMGVHITGGFYDWVTNRIFVDGPQSYIRLKITNQ